MMKPNGSTGWWSLRILSLSDAGELPLSRTFVSLEELLERVAAAYTPHARKKNIALQVHLSPSLPDVNIDQGPHDAGFG